MIDLQDMIEQLYKLAGERPVIDWEEDFITMIYHKTEKGNKTETLTEKQVELIITLFNKYYTN